MTLDLQALDRLSRECIHCGLCLEACPTYTLQRAEPESPRGRLHVIKAILSGRVQAGPEYFGPLDRCVGCRACETACPSAVDYGHLLEHVRAQFVRPGRAARGERLAWQVLLDHLLIHPVRMRAALVPLRMVQRLSPRGVEVIRRKLPRLLARQIELAGPPPTRSDAALPEFTPAVGERHGKVALLTGCVMDAMYRPVHEATIRMLAIAGYDVWVPPHQGCCGALHLHEGDFERAHGLQATLLNAFGVGRPAFSQLAAVIINSAGCGAALKDLAREPASTSAREFAGKVRDVSEFLASVTLPEPRRALNRQVVYHDPCHLAHGQKIRQAPRDLLARVRGLTLRPLVESDRCCGGAGAYTMLQPEMADRLLERKIAHLLDSGAEWVVTGNPSCLMQIAMGLRRQGKTLEILHTVQVLDRAWNDEQSLG